MCGKKCERRRINNKSDAEGKLNRIEKRKRKEREGT